MTGKSGLSSPGSVRLRRDELLQLLDRSADFALTLLLAPAGFGKSTLLKQWQQHRPELRSTLLTLDPGDADPVRFFRRLNEVLRHAVPEFDTLSYNHLSAEIALPPAMVAESLEQAFAAVREPLWLLLDDFHHAGTPFIQEVMALLLERLPAHVHIVMTTRRHPDFSLSRLKLEDRLLLIDGHDLRVSAPQVRQLAQRLQLTLTDAEVGRLLELTEGWMAGVRIALLVQSRSGPGALERFNGRQPEIVDYFAHVVLRDLTPDLRDFVLCTAALEEFDAAFCDAVLARSDSARLINLVAHQALFLQECEGRPGWYRYHLLFQDFLENRLRVEMPERVAPLHAAAAAYLLRQGATELALQHSQRSSPQSFELTLSDCCKLWLSKGDYPSIMHWLGNVPEEKLAASGDLALPFISALILSRRFNQALYYLDVLAATAPDGSTILFLEMMLQLFQHDTDFRMHADHAVLLESCRHHDIRAFSLAMIAYHHMLHADFVPARKYALQAKAVLGELGYTYLESYADLILILCDRNTGQILGAIQRATDLVERTRGQAESPAWVNATTAMAVVRYEQNCLDEAQRLCEEALPLVNTACATELLVAVYLTLSRLLAHKGERTRAQRLTTQLGRILQLGNYDRFVGQLACEELLQAMASGRSEDVEKVARQHQLPERLACGTWLQSRPYEEGWERYGLAAALYLRSLGRAQEAEAVLAVLSLSTHEGGVLARAVVIDANRVVLMHQRGEPAAAACWLQQMVREHGLPCINRIVFDEAPGFADCMRQAHQHYQLTLPDGYLMVFRDVLAAGTSDGKPGADDAAPASLTEKEVEILDLLQKGLSNSAISAAIGIALSTTKWHLKNIFAKLGVANRTAAILRVSQMPREKPVRQ
jgi:LuxR family maltose regulon positive regulatory protein